MSYLDSKAFALGARAYGTIEFTTPHGTAAGLIDTERGVLEIFVEHETDPLDWEIVCGLLGRVGVEHIGEPSYLAGVDVWTIRFREDVSAEVALP